MFTFIAGTPKVTINNDGTTYNIAVQFSAENDGSFECVLKNEVSSTAVMRQPCNSLSTNFSRVQKGRYTIKVKHLSENGREVITATVHVPPLTS